MMSADLLFFRTPLSVIIFPTAAVLSHLLLNYSFSVYPGRWTRVRIRDALSSVFALVGGYEKWYIIITKVGVWLIGGA
jgi:hypothetical protein